MRNSNNPNGFNDFLRSLPENERSVIRGLVSWYRSRIDLSEKQTSLMVRDYELAILYQYNSGMTPEDIEKLLSPKKLGDFYNTERTDWYALDSTAKIYPLSMHYDKMSIFRLSAYMKENIVPEILQMALTFCIKRFPHFATTLKRGFFWHYLDATTKRYPIEPDSSIPCEIINVSKSDAQSFRVLYYQNRISLEFFHVLTDGTGGMVFLATLAGEYLRLLGINVPAGGLVYDPHSAPSPGDWSNDFEKAKTISDQSGFSEKAAVQLIGNIAVRHPCRVLHYELDSAKLKQLSKEKKVTATALMLTVVIIACKRSAAPSSRNIQIQVPVNMRKFYESSTLRNFSLYGVIRTPYSNVDDFDNLLLEVQRQLSECTDAEELSKTLAFTNKLIRFTRFIPLIIKRPVARIIYGFLGDKSFTNTLSNMGMISLSDSMTPYLEKFDFVLGTVSQNRAACGMIGYGGKVVLTVTKNTHSEYFENAVYKLFSELGLSVTVYGSEKKWTS